MDKTYFNRERPQVKTTPYKIFVDQAGYFPHSVKKAAMAFPCEGFVITDEFGSVCYEGKASHCGYDSLSGDDVYIADFSDFDKKGFYRICAKNDRSAIFYIGENVYDKVFSDISKAFYYLRCGCGLEEKYAGIFTHGKCHTDPALLWEDKKTALDVTGGWHDAGDYGRYVTAGACAVAHILYAYKMFSKSFDDRRLNIPENGMPDILSECRYELSWLMKMQRPDGGVYHKATTQMHAPFVMPENNMAQMYVFPVSSMATADLAAVCALASGVYEKFDKAFSDKLYRAAELSCKWLDNNPDFIGFKNPDGCNTGPYGEHDDHSNRFWAYAEMYALTGRTEYHGKMKKALEKDFPVTAFGYAEMGGFGALSYLLCGYDADSGIKKRFADSFHNEAERLKVLSDNCGYGCAMDERCFHWGSNMTLLKNGMIFAVSDFLNKTDEYRYYTEAQLHYLLGMNALGYSYVTGNGEFCCNFPHLRPAFADGIDECIPGMVSGGPNRFPSDPDAKILIPGGTPPMKCYADYAGCYSLNEITIYWNSPAVFVLAYLIDNKKRKENGLSQVPLKF